MIGLFAESTGEGGGGGRLLVGFAKISETVALIQSTEKTRHSPMEVPETWWWWGGTSVSIGCEAEALCSLGAAGQDARILGQKGPALLGGAYHSFESVVPEGVVSDRAGEHTGHQPGESTRTSS